MAFASAGLMVLAAYQAFVLDADAASQAVQEQATRRVLYAAIDLYRADPASVDLASLPDPVWAPDLTMGELVDLYDESRVAVGEYTAHDLATAAGNITLDSQP